MNKIVTTINGITMIEMPTSMLKVVWLDREKRTGAQVTKHENYANANFFAYYSEEGIEFRLPVGHLKCDIYPGFELYEVEEHYMHERGKIKDGKFTFNSGRWAYDNPTYNRAVSTLFIKDGKAFVADVVYLDPYLNCDYIISGIPVLRHGEDVNCYDYVLPQGWGRDTLKASYHVFVGIKEDNADKVYLMYYQSTSDNLIYGMEFYNKIKDLGFYNILMFDGGGSFIYNCPDLRLKKMTSTVRVIDAVFTFDEPDELDRNELLNRIKNTQWRIDRAQEELKWAQDELAEMTAYLRGDQPKMEKLI